MYKSSGETKDKFEAIRTTYNELTPTEKAKIDKIAAELQTRIRERGRTVQGLGEQGALELIGALGMLFAKYPENEVRAAAVKAKETKKEKEKRAWMSTR